jgi:antitoxin component YwqK of YwqJK toxin-antitoxin module
MSHGIFRNGNREGFWTFWLGDSKREGVYKDGKEEGVWTTYYEDGYKSEVTYKKGEFV